MQRKDAVEDIVGQTDESHSDVSLPISIEAYNAVIEGLEPLEIRLVNLRYEVNEACPPGFMLTAAELDEASIESSQVVEDGGYIVIVKQRARFGFSGPDAEGAYGEAVFSVRLRFSFQPPLAFFPIFLHRNIKLYTHPALRDLVSSLATRSNMVAQPVGSVSVRQAVGRRSLPSNVV